MHLLETLANEILTKFPDAKTFIDRPLNHDGVWVLDVVRSGKHHVIEWFADDKLGLSLITKETGYGEGPDEVLTSIEDLRTKLETALA